jgi:nitric oxide reductase NorE protein
MMFVGKAVRRLVGVQPIQMGVKSPGTDGLWTFVFIDMTIFLMIFVTFMGERLGHVDIYTASQASLNPLFGFANTLLLLTSSWCVVRALDAAKTGDAGKVRRELGRAWMLGFIFGLDKCVEYVFEIRRGVTPATNSFFSYYFFITVVHFAHVLAGMLFLGYCRSGARERVGSESYRTGLENVGLYWHMVDVLWIFIFPMLYLVGRR